MAVIKGPPFRCETFDRHCVITLGPRLGELPQAAMQNVGSKLVERLSIQNGEAFLVDLSSHEAIGSELIALVARLSESVKGRGGRMAVIARGEVARAALEVSSASQRWTVADCREQGLETLGVASPSQNRKRRATRGPALLLLLPLLGAGAGLFLILSPAPAVGDARISFGLLFGCASAALVAGAAASVREPGGPRGAGIAVILASLGLIVAGVVKAPAAGAGGGDQSEQERARPERERGGIRADKPSLWCLKSLWERRKGY